MTDNITVLRLGSISGFQTHLILKNYALREALNFCHVCQSTSVCHIAEHIVVNFFWVFSSKVSVISLWYQRYNDIIPGPGRFAGERIGYPLQCSWASLVAQLVKNLPALQETWVWSLGWEDPLEKGKVTHSSILTWEFHELHSPWGHKESNTTEWLSLSLFRYHIINPSPISLDYDNYAGKFKYSKSTKVPTW